MESTKFREGVRRIGAPPDLQKPQSSRPDGLLEPKGTHIQVTSTADALQGRHPVGSARVDMNTWHGTQEKHLCYGIARRIKRARSRRHARMCERASARSCARARARARLHKEQIGPSPPTHFAKRRKSKPRAAHFTLMTARAESESFAPDLLFLSCGSKENATFGRTRSFVCSWMSTPLHGFCGVDVDGTRALFYGTRSSASLLQRGRCSPMHALGLPILPMHS